MDKPTKPTILEDVVSRLRLLGRSRWPEVAEATGVPYHSIRKIAYGDRRNPQFETLQALVTHLSGIRIRRHRAK